MRIETNISRMLPITRKDIRDLMHELSKIDYGEPLPELNDFFVNIWTSHYQKIIDLLPQSKQGGKVLEIGVGFGITALLLKRFYNCSVIATEHVSRAYVHTEFKDRIEKEGIGITLHDLNDPMPFGDGTFDAVFYCDVMEHLPATLLDRCFDEIRRVSNKDGVLILSTPNLARLPNRLVFLAGLGINPPTNPRKVGETYDHIREFTLGEIESLMAGKFEILQVEFGLIPFFNRRFNRVNSILSRVYPKFGDEIYLLAKVGKKWD
jgi:SAM-dependent methyltransferase